MNDVISKIMISRDDKLAFFNHSFYQHMLFNEKNMNMIQEFQKILHDIYPEDEEIESINMKKIL